MLNSLEDVYGLFRQVERESLFDENYKRGYDEGYARGFEKGKLESKEEIILNMLEESFDIATIQRISGCSSKHIFEIQKRQFKDSKCPTDTIDQHNSD